MKKLLALSGEQAVDVVLIEYPDRLVRLGFGYLEQVFGWKCSTRQSNRNRPKN